MPDIFDEVDQDLRADRARALLRRYGAAMLGAVALVVLGVAGWEAWTWQRGRLAARVADQYIAAATAAAAPAARGPDGHAARQAAIARFRDLAQTAPAGYRTLARLRAAGLLADDGDVPAANAEWDAIAADDAAPQSLRDLANLQWSQHAVDSGDPASVTARLEKLAGPQSPFHGLALESLALLSLRQGKADAARDTLRQVAADPATSDGLRARATGLLVQLGDPPPADAAPASPTGPAS